MAVTSWQRFQLVFLTIIRRFSSVLLMLQLEFFGAVTANPSRMPRTITSVGNLSSALWLILQVRRNPVGLTGPNMIRRSHRAKTERRGIPCRLGVSLYPADRTSIYIRLLNTKILHDVD